MWCHGFNRRQSTWTHAFHANYTKYITCNAYLILLLYIQQQLVSTCYATSLNWYHIEPNRLIEHHLWLNWKKIVVIASDKDCLFIVICRICRMFNNNFKVEDWKSLFKIDYLLIKSTHWLDLYNFVDHLTMLKQSQCTCHSNNTFEVDAPKFESIFLRESSDA